jgi:hypothetical protein
MAKKGGVNMAERTEETTVAIHRIPQQPVDNSITFRVPKPNMQVAVLGLVAFITLFQTFQLVRISGSSNTATVKAAPAAATTGTGSNGTGSGADASTPQSMVGGC